ncbi:MAG: MAPEG family protein [Dokdonella sp.]|uniref:MAPEG family protein n=1 Tax=Dokdonella sp. TaxID=2291710 RepID=UPI0025BF5EE2|nr:MAPEG family protein [Dokdonella sp.]MBX3700044.1 MAPEG family protein [Dokdonella sp.]MCW5578963.1 MAPEG family protein [Dokdonella sp.]
MQVTGIYVALATFLVIGLALGVSMRRGQVRVGLGSGGDSTLLQRIRAHANALENLPLALLLLLCLELRQTSPLWLHGFGSTLIVARVMHAFGLWHSAGTSIGRFVGTLLTWSAMLAMSALLLWRWLMVGG